VLLEVQQCERVVGTFHVIMPPYNSVRGCAVRAWFLHFYPPAIPTAGNGSSEAVTSLVTVRTWNILWRQNWKTYTSASG